MAQNAQTPGTVPTDIDPSVPPRLAQVLVQLMHKSGEPDFDYNEESIEQISLWISHARKAATDEETRQMAQLAAAFVGDCLCRLQGGRWISNEGETAVHLPNGIVCRPFIKAQKQLANGESDSLIGFYRSTCVLGTLTIEELQKFASGELDISQRLAEAGVNITVSPSH
ncbi:MAG: hypothetical protein AB7F36_11790 [Reyranellaceae bacterium]